MMRRKLLYAGACAVLVLLLAGFAGLGFYNRQQEQKLASAKKSVQQAVLAYNFDSQNSVDTEQLLLVLASQIRDRTLDTNAPGQAEFLLQSAEIQTDITHLAQFASYSKKVGILLAGQQLGGKFVSSDDALAQATKWQKFNDALKGITAPAMVRKQHDVLVASTATEVAIANKASDAYKANDAMAIADQSKAANDELAKIQAVYDDVYAAVRAQQALIVAAANKL